MGEGGFLREEWGGACCFQKRGKPKTGPWPPFIATVPQPLFFLVLYPFYPTPTPHWE